MAASTAPKATVASGSAATRGSARRPANARGSAEAACEDTTPEPPAADAEGGGGEQADERDERGGHVAARARQLRRGPGPRAARAGRRRRPAWWTCRPGRAPCAARAWRWPAGRPLLAGAALDEPEDPWPAEPEPPEVPPPPPVLAPPPPLLLLLLLLPAPRAARRPRWSTSRQPVYSSESAGSCVERLLVLRLRVGAVDVLVAAGVAQQLGHAALGAGGRGHGQAEDDQGCQQSAHGAVATGRRSGDLPAGLPLRG